MSDLSELKDLNITTSNFESKIKELMDSIPMQQDTEDNTAETMHREQVDDTLQLVTSIMNDDVRDMKSQMDQLNAELKQLKTHSKEVDEKQRKLEKGRENLDRFSIDNILKEVKQDNSVQFVTNLRKFDKNVLIDNNNSSKLTIDNDSNNQKENSESNKYNAVKVDYTMIGNQEDTINQYKSKEIQSNIQEKNMDKYSMANLEARIKKMRDEGTQIDNDDD